MASKILRKLRYNRIALFLNIVWRRTDNQFPDRMDCATAREVACIIYPKGEE